MKETWSPAGSNHVISDCILHQLGVTPRMQCVHQLVFMKGDCPGRQAQDAGDFFKPPAFRQQLQYFALAWGDSVLFLNKEFALA